MFIMRMSVILSMGRASFENFLTERGQAREGEPSVASPGLFHLQVAKFQIETGVQFAPW